MCQKISVNKILEIKNPFQSLIWVKLNSPLTQEEIFNAIPINPSVSKEMDLIWDIESREKHAGRILWLYQNWSDNFPIELDFGMPDIGYPATEFITDGHHRLMAAIMLKKEWIYANCSGSIACIQEFEYKN